MQFRQSNLAKVISLLLLVFILNPYFAFSQTENEEGSDSNEESTEKESKTREIELLNKRISEKRQKVAEIEKSIEGVKKDISKNQLQKVSFQNQIAILENRQTQILLDIKATQEKIDTLELEIRAFTLEIESKEVDIEKQKKIIAEFTRTLHYENGKNYLEILAAYDNFSDFYNRLQYLQSIESDMGKSAKGLRLAKTELEEKKELTEERQQSYNNLKATLEEKKRTMEEQIYAKDDLLNQTRSSEARFQTLLQNLRNQYQEIENEISAIESEVRRKLEDQNKLDSLQGQFDTDKLFWPMASRYITARFHDPSYPYRHIFEHNAVDIRSGQGTPIKAAASGYVGRARRCTNSSCYSYVMIIHSGGISTLYGHMSKIVVDADQFVTRGDIIGLSGGTPGTVGAGPFVTGPHLHFEVRKNGIPVDPLNYLIRDY